MDAASPATLKAKLSKPRLLPADQRAMQGVWLLIAALGIFFFSSILLYVVYIALRIEDAAGEPAKALFLPRSFVPSTLLLIGVSGFLELAYRSAKRERESLVKSSMVLACFFGLLFMAVQSEGMYRLVSEMSTVTAARKNAYAFTFVLALLHALHVVAGIVGLVLSTMQSIRNKYDHERNFGLRFCAIYWHFLDIVWVLLLASFIIAAQFLRS